MDKAVSARPLSAEDVEAQDLRSWIQSLGHASFAVKVIRLWPKTHKGVNCEGTVGTYEEFIDEEKIKEDHGGGKFKIVVHHRGPSGTLRFLQQRSVTIAGPPRIDSLANGEDVAHAPLLEAEGGGALAQQAMSSMQWQLKQALEEGRKGSQQSPFDPRVMQMLQEPMMEQLRALRESNNDLQRALHEKDARIVELIHRKPDTTLQDDLVKNMWNSESARIEGLRAQHDSEMRQLKTFHADEISRIRDQAREDLVQRTKSHEREIDALRDAKRAEIDSIKLSYDARIDGLKSENARLQAELAQLKGEIGELRSRKDKSLTEQAEEIVKVQEAFKALGVGGSGGDEDEDDSKKPLAERLLGRVLENPEAIGQLIGGVRSNIPAQAAAPQAPQLPPPGQPFQGPDGRVYMTRPDGRVQRLNPAKRAKAAAAKAAVVAAKTEPAAPKPPDAADLALAIQFMEGAFANGTDPTSFANGARSVIPGEILAYVEKVGIDDLLTSIDPNSPLATQAGRNWIRQVAKILLESAPE